MKYLDKSGLTYFWSKVKSNIPTKTSDLTNDSSFTTLSAVCNAIYPVGSVYITVESTNPGTLFGGTWALLAPGRTLVGVDTNDTDFNTVKKTGGSKAMQNHSHKMKEAVVTGRESAGTAMGIANGSWYTFKENGGVANGYSTDTAGTGDSGNLQPYITCYIWERIS